VISRRGTRSLVGTKALSLSGASADFFELMFPSLLGEFLNWTSRSANPFYS
jgi:hypothetical protein